MGSLQHVREWGELKPERTVGELLDTIRELADVTVSAAAATQERLVPLVDKQVATVGKLIETIHKYNHLTAKILDSKGEETRLERELETLRGELNRLRVARTNIGFRGPKKR